MKIKIIIGIVVLVIIAGVFVSFNSVAQNDLGRQDVTSAERVGVGEPTVCCEKTNADLFCQDVRQEECSPAVRQPPTSCESTSFCKGGYCYDSTEGTCLDNVPQMVCNKEGGTWSEEKPAACNLGCCILGDQASFVTLVMCKRLSGFYGLETDWRDDITSEPLCILTAGGHVKGACVFEQDFEKTCKFVTRDECTEERMLGGGISDEESDDAVGDTGDDSEGDDSDGETPFGGVFGGDDNSEEGENGGEVQPSPGGVEFHEGKLCTAEELGTNCAPTKKTICLEGKEEVYFVDTCGNPGNIYDANKINDDDYWSNVKKKSESCGTGGSNENSQICGNCNYLQGSFCREVTSETANPTYGNFVCASLNCDVDGKKRIHGESWCAFDKLGAQGLGRNPVGSKFFRNICINGEVVVEPCAEYRQEECIKNDVAGFSEAACRVNRWQDCTAQTNIKDCINSDRRDCLWLPGIEYVLMGRIMMPADSADGPVEGNSLGGIGQRIKQLRDEGAEIPRGACVPENPPGLDFWSAESGGDAGGEGGGMTEAEQVCAQANAMCPVTYTRGIGGDWECSENCECLPGGELEIKRAMLCTSMGDCGPNVNFVGSPGSGKGYKVFQRELDND